MQCPESSRTCATVPVVLVQVAETKPVQSAIKEQLVFWGQNMRQYVIELLCEQIQVYGELKFIASTNQGRLCPAHAPQSPVSSTSLPVCSWYDVS